MQEIIERYIAAWNETDPARRRGLVDSLWAADGSYTDPLADAHGREEIDGLIGAVQGQFPGPGVPARRPCRREPQPGPVHLAPGPVRRRRALVIGFDVAVLDASGQIRSVHGFLDKVPAAA